MITSRKKDQTQKTIFSIVILIFTRGLLLNEFLKRLTPFIPLLTDVHKKP